MISVITPSYQQLDWLRLALASVTDQEGVDVEHIVQDGGSVGVEDMFRPTVGSSVYPYHRARLFVEKDRGMYDAINRGLRRASGEICGYLNCDEQYLPGALSDVANYFTTHPEIDVLFGDAILVNAKGVPISYRRVTLPSLAHLRLADLNTLTCATFFRRRLVDAGHVFPSHLKIAGDQYWVFQLLKSGIKMGVLPKPLSVFTFTGSNLSHTAVAGDERYSWLPVQEKPSRWLRPLVVLWHRLRKFVAGAYRRRNITVEIYAQDQPERRRKISSRVGFHWPKNPAA